MEHPTLKLNEKTVSDELTPEEKDDLRSEAFWSGYTPEYNRKVYILNLQDSIKNSKNTEDLKIYEDIFSLIERNDYKLNIKFLESLNDTQKKKLSSLILKDQNNNLKSCKITWKSIYIWIVWYWICNEPYINEKSLKKFKWLITDISQDFEWLDIPDYIDPIYKFFGDIITSNILQDDKTSENDTVHDNKLLENGTPQDFEKFNPTYFMQAYNFLRKRNTDERNPDISIFDIVAEYKYIKNMRKDIHNLEEILKSNQHLHNNYSIKDLHAMDDCWSWRDVDVSTWRKLCELLRSYRDNKDNTDKSSQKVHYINLDTPTWIWLYYENKPIAFISFYIRNWEELVINQIKKVPIYNSKYDKDKQQIVLGGKEFSKNTSSDGNNEYRSEVLYMAISELAKKYNISNIKFNNVSIIISRISKCLASNFFKNYS